MLIKPEENEYLMYKNILLTDCEIALVRKVIGQYLKEKDTPEARNLTIILNQFRGKNPTTNNTKNAN
jgi:hypothetical protein